MRQKPGLTDDFWSGYLAAAPLAALLWLLIFAIGWGIGAIFGWW